MNEEIIWAEKYRPTKLSEMVLPEDTRERFNRYLATKEIPHLLLTGSAGVGKTTAARILCGEAGYDFIFINASMEATLDTLRDRVTNFVSRTSLMGQGIRKAVIMDEADGATSQSFFNSLRPMIEEFSSACSFIFTANHVEKIPQPIISRCQWFDFQISDQLQYAAWMYDRVEDILRTEKTEFDETAVKRIIMSCYPDLRRSINVVQQNSSFLKDPGLAERLKGFNVTPLFDAMKRGDLPSIQEIVRKEFSSLESVYGQIYQALRNVMTDESVPKAILILDDFQRSHRQSVDTTIHVAAFAVKLATVVKFK